MAEVDIHALRERYRAERDKRLRADGNAQFVDVEGEFAHYADDPYADPNFAREPVSMHVEVAIAGAGIAGILASTKLPSADISSFVMIEQASDFGGTWYWNRYPGAMCDVEAYIYLPLLEEMGYMPTQRYVFGSEIREYLQLVAQRYRLYDHALLQTIITYVEWDPAKERWRVHTNRGDDITADAVIVSNGPLTRPKLPGIKGIENFRGTSFHTSRWDFDYTGGSTLGGLDRLAGKRVAVIGTGCTAIQCIPYVAETAEYLYVVQRTSAAPDYRNNSDTDPEWWEQNTSTPGWQYTRMQNFTAVISGEDVPDDMVHDGWTSTFQRLTGVAARRAGQKLGRKLTLQERTEFLEIADAEVMESIRERIEREVEDPQVAELLKPWYKRWCKRPMWHDEYLPVFNRPNAALLDTDGQGPECFTETGIVVEGVEYSIDCVIFATGFEVGTNYVRRIGYDIVGREGRRLSEKWSDGLRTLHGMHSHDFPNMYFMGTTQTGVSPNYTHMVTEQARHISYILAEVRRRGLRIAEATQAGEDWWQDEIHRLSRRGSKYYEECTPGYNTAEGNLDDPYSLVANSYGDGPTAFFRVLGEWREDGRLRGLELR